MLVVARLDRFPTFKYVGKYQMSNYDYTNYDYTYSLSFPYHKFCSAIRVGMWRRNGQVMLDQVMNYGDVPFCRIFRDLDILLIQVRAN